jgi:beta-N-acetylhexosaminidase
MSAHVVVEAWDKKLPATLSATIIQEQLRTKLGFDGVLFSDDLEMMGIALHYAIPEAAVRAIEAGCDCVLICSDEQVQEQAWEALIARAEQDSVFRARCEQAASRMHRMRRKIQPGRRAVSLQALQADMQATDAQMWQSRLVELFQLSL